MENKQIRRLGVGLMFLFVLLFAQLNWLQVIDAKNLSDDPRNTRNAVRDFSQPRGEIVSADGKVLARSDPTDDSFKRLRVYPPETAELFSHVVGYFSFTYGSEGVERTYNDELAGRTDEVSLDRLADLLLDRKHTSNVTLTIPVPVQQAAAQALGDRKGAVVALDPRDGRILAMVDFPRFDPNGLSLHDQKQVQGNRGLLLLNPDRPLLPRAYRERFFPGSTFKVVTAATAIANGKGNETFPQLTQLDLPQTNRDLRNFGGERCGGTLADALRVSCNTSFGQLGLDLGGDALSAGAQAFGFDSKPPLDLPAVATSAFPEPSTFEHNKPALAYSAIGQFDVAATPLQMALVAAGIANGGSIMTPHVMQEVRNDNGDVLEKYAPKEWRRAVDAAVAGQVRDMMIDVVNRGTARSAAIPGIQVAAKTGTAQLGTTPPSSHAWMIGFAPAEAPRVAVAVLVQGQPGVSEVTGGRVAGPIVRQVLQAALAAVPQ
jgi:peptidoglycan glycosyltransferase